MSDVVIRSSREVLARHARSFRWAALFLGRRRGDDAAVAYAFCRLVDDTVDEQPDPQMASKALMQLRGVLEAESPPSEPSTALVVRYRQLALRSGFGLGPARDLIEGARSDLGRVRVTGDGELLRYCYRVAGTVGLMMCRILGVTRREALSHAIDLGIGMQLTNICRDVLEDAGRDRVYLPASRLRAVGVEQDELVAGQADRRAVASVVQELLDLAEQYYLSADRGMRYIPWAPRLAIFVASRIYRAIGRRLSKRFAADALRGRVIVPPLSKVVLVVAAGAAWIRSLGRSKPVVHTRALHAHLQHRIGTRKS